MAKVVIFGLLDTAELAHYYLTNDSEHEVVAFTVSKAYMNVRSFKDLPVVAFEEIESHYPPDSFQLFCPMTGKGMNELREAIYLQGKAKGYDFVNYISSRATVLTNQIGDNCFILEDNTIQPFVSIGSNVAMWSGNHIGHHSTIEDHVFFTSHIVLSGHCQVGHHSFFGVNATIRDYTKIAPYTLVGMAAAVVKDTETLGVYLGNPAKKMDGKTSKELY